MNQIEVAKLVIEKLGFCNSINCKDCPVFDEIEGCVCFSVGDGSKTTWMQNWLKENEVTMSDKIQMTEEQARKFLKEILCASTDRDLSIDRTIQNMKNTGYIIKSELQQKVERVEASLKEYIDGHSVDILDTFKASIDVIQLLKQSHPEFKEK